MQKSFINNIINKTFILFSFLFILTAFGCEDDPILEPSSDSESDEGSYGNLSLHGDGNDNPDNDNTNPFIY